MSELPEPKFRKTKTEKWAVMAPVETLEAALAGDGVVQVLKKSGDHSKFTVGSLGKPFDVDGIQMCYGYAPGDEDTSGGQSSAGQSSAGQSSAGQSSAGQNIAGQNSAGRSAPARQQQGPPPQANTPPPPRDDSEPLPEFQGEDQWDDAF